MILIFSLGLRRTYHEFLYRPTKGYQVRKKDVKRAFKVNIWCLYLDKCDER